MLPRDVTTAYWRDAVYEPMTTMLKDIESRNISEGDPREPAKFKLYRGRPRVRLPPPRLRLPSGTPPARSAIDDGWDDQELSTFLFHAYGVNRQDLHPKAWPFHRVVASARCFFPTELYLALPARTGGSSGIHYYDPMHHCLVQVCAGDQRARVAAAVGVALDDAALVLVLTSVFWKTAFRYREYAYRLCCQEVGMVAGSVLLSY
jgi:SagB-type dehydrogenase family enzyme